MAVLLDTCAILDLVVEPQRMSAAALATLSSPATEIVISTATAWEIAIKVRRGKLPNGDRLVSLWAETLLDLRAESQGIDDADAIRAGMLVWEHRDPFDRMLVAQAMRYNLQLATSDRAILASGMVTTLNTRDPDADPRTPH